MALSVKRGVDGTAEFLGAGEAVDGWGRGVLVVAVGAGDDDLKAVAPLAFIGGLRFGNGGAPEGAFEVGGGGRVGTVDDVGVDGWIPLEVEVKAWQPLAWSHLEAQRAETLFAILD